MRKKSLVAVIIAVAVVIGGGASYALVQKNNDKKNSEYTTVAKQEEPDNMQKNTDGEAVSSGVYTDYDVSKLVNAEKGKVVLFFHAPWCPTCREADKNFNGSATPDGITLLKTDYDSSTDLKKKYGVTYQHTFVQVDKDGNLIKKWSASNTYDALEKELN